MTTEPRPTAPVLASELRASARRQATSLSKGLVALIAGMVGVAAVLGFMILDYRLDQDVHRLIKIAIGVPLGVLAAIQPQLGLLLFPISAPYLLLLPQLQVPGLNTLNAMLLGVFGMWVVHRVLARQPISRKPWLGWSVLALGIMMVISLARGAAFPVAGYDTRKAALLLSRTFTTLVPYFIALLMVRNNRDSGRLFGGVVVALIAETITAMWFGEWGGGRAKGSMGQPNVLGAFTSISTVLVGAVLLAQRRWLPRLVLLAAAVGGAYATVLTISRGSLIALMVGLLYVAVRSSKVLTVAILVVLATAPAWAPESVKERVLSTQQQDEESDEVELEGSAQARIDTWKATIQVASDHWLDGVGFGALPYVLIDTGKRMGLSHTHDSTHNTFMRMLGEMGVPGLLIYIALLVSCWTLGAAGIKAARTPYERQLAVGLQGATLAMMINCWFGDRFFELDIMCAFWIACALVNDVVNRAKREAA